MLDSRGPPSQYKEEEARREDATEAEIQRLLRQTRLWRIANSAQWVAWGIVQAKVPDIDEALASQPEQGTSTLDDTASDHKQGTVTPRTSDLQTPETTLGARDARYKRPEELQAESLTEGVGLTHDDEEEEEFDYLAYAQQRAMFFWGDVLQLGIVEKEVLPAELLQKIKVVEY